GAPEDRATLAGQLIDQVAAVSGELSRLRREAIEELIGQGNSKATVARMVGLDPSRITRIVGSGVPPERALLSPDGGPVTVALGSKEHAVGDDPSDMISRDVSQAFNALRQALERYGLDCTDEIVPAPGLIE